MTNKEKFLQLTSERETETLTEVKQRIKNRAMLRESQRIALKVLLKLDEIGWSQKDLSKAMNVTPQQITKIVSGKENLTIETQIKLQNILDIPVLASYYEKKAEKPEAVILTFEKKMANIVAQKFEFDNNYQSSKILCQERTDFSKEFYQTLAV